MQCSIDDADLFIFGMVDIALRECGMQCSIDDAGLFIFDMLHIYYVECNVVLINFF